MVKKVKNIQNPTFIIGLCLLVLWPITAFFLRDTIGLTGNPSFVQVLVQMLPAAIGIALMLSVAIKSLPLSVKIVVIGLISIITSYVLYYALSILLISMYGLHIDWSNYNF